MAPPEEAGRERAEDFRAEHNLGIAPIDDMVDVLEQAGLDVVVMRVPDNSGEAGLTMHDPVSGQTVVAVAAIPWSGRQRFTLAHELAHHLKGEHLSGEKLHGHRNAREMEADSFARHLLLPIAAALAVSEEHPQDVAVQVDLLVRRFDVSPAVACLQLEKLDKRGVNRALLELQRTRRAKQLAATNGWLGLWQQRSAAAQQPQGPRRLMARLAAAYRDGMAPLSELADWSNTSREDLAAALAETSSESGE